MRTLPISSPRFALLTGLLSPEQRSRSVIGALALCLFAAAYLVVGHRSPGSYVGAEPVSSADAYRLEIGSILSSNELSPHTHQTLGLLPEATNAVRQSESVLIDGEKLPLAADFTAAWANTLSRADDRKSGWWWGLAGEPERDTRHGVLLYGAYPTAQIPVLRIHGLGASPQAWRELTNDILGSPALRSRYQILPYTYPTNGLMLALARQMRRDLSEFFDVVDPEHVSPQMVVIGHTMGELLAKSLAIESGMSIWNTAFAVAPAQLHASDEIRVLTEGFILKPWSQYPPMQAFAELPISPPIPFYSIIGSIGDGRLDGYVSVRP
jgi:hypothetical protein